MRTLALETGELDFYPLVRRTSAISALTTRNRAQAMTDQRNDLIRDCGRLCASCIRGGEPLLEGAQSEPPVGAGSTRRGQRQLGAENDRSHEGRRRASPPPRRAGRAFNCKRCESAGSANRADVRSGSDSLSVESNSAGSNGTADCGCGPGSMAVALRRGLPCGQSVSCSSEGPRSRRL
jgi:hypothetical protein